MGKMDAGSSTCTWRALGNVRVENRLYGPGQEFEATEEEVGVLPDLELVEKVEAPRKAPAKEALPEVAEPQDDPAAAGLEEGGAA